MGKKVNMKELKDVLANAIFEASEHVKGIHLKDVLPVKPLLAATTVGTGLGLTYAAVRDKIKGSSGLRKKKNIKMYRDIESPLAGEEDAIDNNIYKKSSLAVDIPVAIGSLGIPAVMLTNDIKDINQRRKLKKSRKQVGELRDAVNDAYRQDMMDAYGISDEQELHAAVDELRNRVREKHPELLSKTSALSTPAALTAASSLAFAGFLGSKMKADSKDPNRIQQKDYLNQLDRLYRSRLNSPTIRQLPFSDEELLAMELYKQEKGVHKKHKALEAAESSGSKAVLEEAPSSDFEEADGHSDANTVDIDNPDVQSILKEL